MPRGFTILGLGGGRSGSRGSGGRRRGGASSGSACSTGGRRCHVGRGKTVCPGDAVVHVLCVRLAFLRTLRRRSLNGERAKRHKQGQEEDAHAIHELPPKYRQT